MLVEISSGVALYHFASDTQHFYGYFYTYWISQGILSLLRLWIAIDLGRSFEAVDYLPRWVYWGTTLLALSMAIAAGTATWHQPKNFLELKMFVLIFNRSVCYAWTLFFIALMFIVRFIGVGWSRFGRIVLTGQVALVGSDLIVAEMMSRRVPQTTQAAGILDAFTGISVLLFWVLSLLLARNLQQNRVPQC